MLNRYTLFRVLPVIYCGTMFNLPLDKIPEAPKPTRTYKIEAWMRCMNGAQAHQGIIIYSNCSIKGDIVAQDCDQAYRMYEAANDCCASLGYMKDKFNRTSCTVSN